MARERIVEHAGLYCYPPRRVWKGQFFCPLCNSQGMERKTDAAKRGGGFLSNKLFETIRERERKGDDHRFDGIRSSSSSSSSLVVPLLFQLGRHSACHRSVSHSFLVSKKEESKTPRQNFSASPSIRGMITVREGRFSLSRSLFSLPCLSSPFLPFFSILSFSIEESAKRAIVFCLSQHPRFHNNRVGV